MINLVSIKFEFVKIKLIFCFEILFIKSIFDLNSYSYATCYPWLGLDFFFLFSTALLWEHVCRLYEISYYKMSQIVMLGLKLQQEPLPNQLIVPH